MALKPPMHLRYSKLCYYCVCQVCNLIKCPFTRSRNRFAVCQRCLSCKDPHPRLDCDFFQHFRKTDVYRIKARHKLPSGNAKIFVLVCKREIYGPMTLKEVNRAQEIYGGVIRILNIFDHDFDKIK